MAATSSLLARAHEQPSKHFVTWLTSGLVGPEQRDQMLQQQLEVLLRGLHS